MQTAIEWLFDKLKKSDRRIWDDLLEKGKEMEKKQIIDAWEHYRTGSGKRYYNDVYGIGNILSPTYSGENPFIPIQTETYVKKGIDKTDLKKLITEIMNEDAKDGLYNTSSQTEISDEEIEKQALIETNKYVDSHQSHKEIRQYAFAKGFTICAKWYREQLKQKQ